MLKQLSLILQLANKTRYPLLNNKHKLSQPWRVAVPALVSANRAYQCMLLIPELVSVILVLWLIGRMRWVVQFGLRAALI